MKPSRQLDSLCLILVLASTAGCAASPARNSVTASAVPISTAAAGHTSPQPPPPEPARLSAREPIERPELGQYFEAEHVGGTIALFDTQDKRLICSDVARCKRQFIPASTFKIPNSIIALETGVVEDSETVLPWDGQPYPVPDWNHDNTLRTAIRVSCVPCYRDIAKKIGPERMRDWLGRLEYGNRDNSGPKPLFWLHGQLRISPIEQLDFLERMENGKLPIQQRTLDIVRDILALDVGPSHVLYGKTGSIQPPDVPPPGIGWFVGYVALGDRRVYFATLIDSHAADVDVLPVRRRVTESVLRSLGALPS
jgi:beta-lactamase class D